MICEKPYYKLPLVNKIDIVLSEDARLAATPMPCGKCLPCKINRSRVWVTRLLLEDQQSISSCFITLTYDDENLPEGENLDPEEVKKFIKNLRNNARDRKIRYFMVGEYGDKEKNPASDERPHYHGALFNVSYMETELLEKSWEKGFIRVGNITEQSARYIVGYVTKYMDFKASKKLEGRYPEFMRCSKRPGLGYEAAMQIGTQAKGKDIKPIREIRIGRKKYPLGRYLNNVIAQYQESTKEKMDCDFYDYQYKFHR